MIRRRRVVEQPYVSVVRLLLLLLLGRLSGYATQVQSLKPMAAAAGVGSGQEKKSRLSFISTFQGRYNFV